MPSLGLKRVSREEFARVDEIDIATADYHTDPLSASLDGDPGAARPCSQSAGRLDHELHALPQELHRFDKGLVGDRDDVGDVTPNQLKGDLPEIRRAAPSAIVSDSKPSAALQS